MPGRPQAPATYLCRRKVLSELSAAFASVMGGRLSLAQARSATLTFASEAMAAAASLEKSRPVKFLIKGLPDLALLGSLPEPSPLFFDAREAAGCCLVQHYFLCWKWHRGDRVEPMVTQTIANFVKGVRGRSCILLASTVRWHCRQSE
jgi:hypothetical protein